jgi:hypothetical protein
MLVLKSTRVRCSNFQLKNRGGTFGSNSDTLTLVRISAETPNRFRCILHRMPSCSCHTVNGNNDLSSDLGFLSKSFPRMVRAGVLRGRDFEHGLSSHEHLK